MTDSERYETSVMARLLRIFIGDDPDSEEHLAYRIAIHTDRGVIWIHGNHDSGPDLTQSHAIVVTERKTP